MTQTPCGTLTESNGMNVFEALSQVLDQITLSRTSKGDQTDPRHLAQGFEHGADVDRPAMGGLRVGRARGYDQELHGRGARTRCSFGFCSSGWQLANLC